MVADHRSELEAVEVGHAHVHEHDRHVVAQELVERLARRGRLQERLVELLEDDLVAQQLRRLVVDEEDVDPVVAVHAIGSISDAATCAEPTGAAPC